MEGVFRVEFGKKGMVRKRIVSLDPGVLERSAGEICQWVVFARNGKRGHVRGLVDQHTESKRTEELLSDEGALGAHFDSPRDS